MPRPTDGARFLPGSLLTLILAACLALAGCDTAEERATAHYERAKALLAEGDAERAIVEFRNVFQLDGNNAAARLDYANLLVERGELQEALGQFLRLVEQDWSNVAGHKRLADIALRIPDYTTAETHANRAYELDPADPEIRAFKAAVDYHDGKRAAAVAMATEVLDTLPDNLTARMVLVADRMNAGDPRAALAEIDTALAGTPDDEALHMVRLVVLEQIGDRAALGEELARAAALFPGNDSIALSMIEWHLAAGEVDAAEPLLRARAAAEPAGSEARVATELMLARALGEARGAGAARVELERAVADAAAAGSDPSPYVRVLAGIEVSEGNPEAGIARLRALVDAAEPSDARRDTQVDLAQLLAETGDAAASSTLVDAVLAEDPSHVPALKLRARRLIEADQPDAAIRDLRAALNQEPRDSEVLTLMAMAHEREGARELAGERLALAVEVSDRGPAESIRYARFLMQDGRTGPAESVVTAALLRRPADPDLILALGEIRVRQRDWQGAAGAADRLRRLGTPRAAAAADALDAEALNGQNRFAEAVEMLQQTAREGGGDGGSRAAAALAGIVQTYVRAGNLAGARSHLEGAVAAAPDDPLPRLMLAGIAGLEGDDAGAESGYRTLIAARPGYAPAYEGLVLLLAGTGRDGEADEMLAEGLAATGDDPRLLFVRAGRLEQAGDVEGAIAVYEGLYARDSASAVVANNLASLLAGRGDPASLDRAYAIARRLRGTEVPHFQDTYGWIMLGRGEAEEALPYLEKAAAALLDQPEVLYHLGAAQARLGRPAAARATLERALAATTEVQAEAGAMAEARALLDSLAAGPGPEAAPGTTPGATPADPAGN